MRVSWPDSSHAGGFGITPQGRSIRKGDFMTHRPHWSYSSISQFLSCPLRFYFQRILRLPQTTVGGVLLLGSAVHHALAEYHRGIQDGQPVSKDHLHRAVNEGWRQ